MNITLVPFKTPDDKPSRLFTIALLPEETLRIIESPGGCWIREHKTHSEFCIWEKPFPIEKENIKFIYSDGCYNFVSQTGFETDEKHLEWLISLGKIPIVEQTTVFEHPTDLILGYVQFEKQAV